MARRRLATVEEAILLHLLGHSRYSPGDTVSMELAQAGISMSLGIRRSHISMSLDSAKNRGYVEEHLARVRGETRRRKCYFLTPEGRKEAQGLTLRIGSALVNASLPDGSDFHGKLSELVERTGVTGLARAALLAHDGTVRLPVIEPKSAVGTDQRPAAPENFVGRTGELAILEDFLSGRGGVLLLSGMPGVGKTALAARAAADRDLFWFDISRWSSPRNLANHLAAYLDGRGAPRMQQYLRAREVPDMADIGDILMDIDFDLIMIFDDCQNAGVRMKEFLGMLASVCVRSRRIGAGFLARDMPDIIDMRMGLTGESITRIVLEPLAPGESRELLRLRGLDGGDAKTIAEKAGGLPLFLVLAGTGGRDIARDAEEMLARTIYGNLGDRENELLHLLSVFRRPAASDALVEDSQDIELLEALERKSIIFNAGGWNMHNLVRDFYYDRQAPADRDARHERAAEFYNIFSQGPEDRIEETYHLLKARDFESGILNLSDRGHDWLGLGYVDEILYLADLVPREPEAPEDRFNLNFLMASALDLVGDWDTASEHYGICLELARELGDLPGAAEILRREGAILYRKGELDDARKMLLSALDEHNENAGPELLARLQGSLGVVLWRMHDPENAILAHEADLELSTAAGDIEGRARALNNLGILDWESGNMGAALEKYSTALELAQGLDDRKLVAILYSNIADVLRSQDKPAEARRYYEKCLELAEYLKFNWQVAEAYRGLALVTEHRDKYLRKALAIFKRLGAEEDVKSVMELMRNP